MPLQSQGKPPAQGIVVETYPAMSLRHRAEHYVQALQSQKLGVARANPKPGGNPLWRGSLWICASQVAVAQIRELLVTTRARLGQPGGAMLDPGVTTLAGFAEALLTRSGERIRPINPVQRQWILSRLIAKHSAANRLSYFAPIAHAPGFVRQVEQLIVDLKRRDIWPEDYSQQAQGLRERELALIYQSYQDELNQGDSHDAKLYDAEGRFWAARRIFQTHIGSQAADTIAPIRLVYVDGFTDFTAAQYDILRLLSQQAEELRIHLCVDRALAQTDCQGEAPLPGQRTELFAKSRETLARLQTLAALSLADEDTPDGSRPAALAHLQENLFCSYHRIPPCSTATIDSLDAIEVVQATNDQTEIEAIATRVKRLLLAGAEPGEIVVCFRSLQEASDRLRTTFADFGIPVRIEAARPLITSALVRRLLLLLQVHHEDWPFRPLLQLVGDPKFCLWNDQGQQASPEERLERGVAVQLAIRKGQLPRGRRQLLSHLSQNAKLADDSTASLHLQRLGDRAATAHGVLNCLAEILDQLPRAASLVEWRDQLEQVAQRIGLLDTNQQTESAEAVTDREPSDGDPLTVWLLLREQLSSLVPLRSASSEEIPLTQLIASLQQIAKQTSLPQPPTGPAVQVASAETARHLSTQHLLIGGLGEKSFPAPEPAGAFYSDAQLAALAGRSPHAGPSEVPHATRSSEEMLLFFQLVTLPAKSLTLSYAAYDAKAQELQPSPYLADVQRTFGEHTLPTQVMELGQPTTASAAQGAPLSRTQQRAQSVSELQQGRTKPLVQLATSSVTTTTGKNLLSTLRASEHRAQREGFSRWEGLLSSDAAKRAMSIEYGSEHLWSPSQLETYATCPYRFSANKLLRLRPLPGLTLETDAASRGSLLHDTLATLHQRLLESTSQQERVDLLDAYLETLEEVVASRAMHGLEGAITEIQRRELCNWGELYPGQTENYEQMWPELDQPPQPRHFEVRFGPGSIENDGEADQELSTNEPFLFDLGNEQIQLTGQIDRLDLGMVGHTPVFNIIDYKSAKDHRAKPEKLESGEQLQLPLYALAAEQHLLADRGALAWEAGYWSFQGNGFGTVTKKGIHKVQLQIRELVEGQPQATESWLRIQEVLRRRVQELVTGVRSGEFPVASTNDDCTKYCDYRTICRIAHVRSLKKVWPPEEAAEEAAEESGCQESGQQEARQ